MRSDQWFKVDKEGLAKILERRGVAFVLTELFQNAWDEDRVTRVDATLDPVAGKPLAILRVEDDAPDGFRDLADSFTLFAESYKKSDATKRGRFNLGEKLVLALAREARITSTTGTVAFLADGTRRTSRKRTEAGSIFEATVRLTRAQVDEVTDAVALLLPPPGIVSTFNGFRLAPVEPCRTFEAVLPTEVADADGVLRRTNRKAEIELYDEADGIARYLYELGIPVVEIDCQWSINVCQKIPMNLERDGVSPAYLRRLFALTLNVAHEDLTAEFAGRPSTIGAAGHKEITGDALNSVLDGTLGRDRVVRDPNDPEANHEAAAHDHAVVGGNQLPRDVWDRIREERDRGRDLLPSAGRKFPSPQAWDPNGTEVVNPIDPDALTAGQERVVLYAARLGRLLLNEPVAARVFPRMNSNSIAATYDRTFARVDFNLKALGRGWFERRDREGLKAVHRLLIHEFGHNVEGDHLSPQFRREVERLGAALADLILAGEIDPREFGFEV